MKFISIHIYYEIFTSMHFMREFSRVADNEELRKSAREKWLEWTPWIMVLVKRESSTAVKNVMENYDGEDETDGK